MTSKFLQALAKLKTSSPDEVRAERKKSKMTPRGAVAFQADVYRGSRASRVPDTPRPQAAEH